MNAFPSPTEAIEHAERSATGGTDIGVYAVQRFRRTYYDTEVFSSNREYIHVATSTADEQPSGTPRHVLTR